MKNFVFLFTLLMGIVSCSDIAPKGEIALQDTPVEEFTKMDLKGNFKVFFAKGAQNLVSVETYSNIADNLKISTENGTLYLEESRNAPRVDFYTVTVFGKKELTEIRLDNRVEMNISGQVNSPKFFLYMNGGTKFMGAINTSKALMEMKERANANILGRAEELELKVSDSASLVAPFFLIQNLQLNLQNKAFAALQTENRVDGIMQEDSKLIYYGDPLIKVTKKDKAVIEKGKFR